MAGKWLYSVDSEGVRVTPEFMERLRSGNAAALKSLQKRDLTRLYRSHFTRAPRRADAHGLFWSDIPETELIPLVVGGRSKVRPWLPDSIFMVERPLTARKWKVVARYIRQHRKSLRPPPKPKRKFKSRFELQPWEGWNPPEEPYSEQSLSTRLDKDGKGVTVTILKPNPKFELVVVNRHDRAALLKLLNDLDSTTNVERWLGERTVRQGATAHKPLYEDYAAWCDAQAETAAGKKHFAQALVTAGVVKLTRSNAAQRYELELR